MSTKTVSKSDAPIIESRQQLLEVFSKGEKPEDKWLIGTEHEKFVYCRTDFHAPSYDEPGGIRDLLNALTDFGWEPIEENGKVIAMQGSDGTVSLEPAGQLELSGAALDNLHETCAETGRHLQQVKAIGEKTGKGFLGLGMWPDKRRDELPIMPKGRYKIMLDYMPKKGSLGLDMMLRTCTIQTNLDYSSEADMARKFRVGLALQPLATALFANSPFTEGKPNGFLSFRSHIWSDTDADRTGMLPFVFEEGFGYERYADYALDVPMYFAYRGGEYLDASGLSFRDYLVAHVFQPLDMQDTDFFVPADKLDRLVSMYAPHDLLDPMKPGLSKVEDAQSSRYGQPRRFESGGGGLVSTVADYLTFLRMIVSGGRWEGSTILQPETLELMRSNQLAPGVSVHFPMWAMPGTVFGLGFAVQQTLGKDDLKGSLNEYHWGGIAGTHSWMAPNAGITGMCMTQRMPGFWHPFSHEFKRLAYQLSGEG